MNAATIPAIIIPYRREPYLETTLTNIAETADHPYRLYLVNDEPDCGHVPALPRKAPACVDVIHLASRGRGLSYARHLALKAAEASGHHVAILLDAHMSFFCGSAWLSRMHQYGQDNPDTFACAISLRGRPNNMLAAHHLAHGRVECGARLIDRQTNSEGRREIFARRWSDNRDISYARDVACPLGGAYVLRISTYAAIGEPWRLHVGWGCSEQLVALACWYLGYRCRVIPVPACHMYRDQSPHPQRLWRVLHNSLLLAHLFLPEDEEDAAARWLSQYKPHEAAKAAQRLPADEIARLRQLYHPDGEDAAAIRARFVEVAQ